jgi:hypothetical protein
LHLRFNFKMGESFFAFSLIRHKARSRVACFLSLVVGY